MTGNGTSVMFVTANVGSIFEEPSRMLQVWATEFLSTVSRLDPKFIALHCQEVGGKNYEKSMQYVQNFVNLLMESEELRLFDKVRIYLDEDFSSADKFTALGSFYFIHESITDILIYDFSTQSFVDVNERIVYREEIETVTTKEKSKFPLEYFPECKWSRKGFLRTRWNLNGNIFDLVNIHLFHDACNFIAIESYPSEYSETRRQALIYTLDRFQKDEHDCVPIFMFGDFNFRADTKGVVKRLSEGLCRSHSVANSDDSTVEYCDNDEKILCLGKKTFSHLKHQDLFSGVEAEWLREYDKELDSFKEQLFEFVIKFQPSYPFEEGETDGTLYMKTRCPAWCDRVLLTKDALSLVKDFTNPGKIEYGLMGTTSCMGDHKPVYLRIDLKMHSANKKETMADSIIDGKLKMSSIDGQGAGDVLNIGIIDTGQNSITVDRSGLVKRVNSASFVDNNKSKRDDWKNSRCNSDVSWNPTTSQEVFRMNKLRTPLFRAGSKIRLISTSTSVHLSLPRLTSHHSSSDEEWFEVVDGDDDVLETPVSVKNDGISEEGEDVTGLENAGKFNSQDKNVGSAKNRFSIWKRLIRVENESRDVTDTLPKTCNFTCGEDQMAAFNEAPLTKQMCSKTHNPLFLKTRSLLRSVKRNSLSKNDDIGGSWETIDLSANKPKENESIDIRRSGRCCVLQ